MEGLGRATNCFLGGSIHNFFGGRIQQVREALTKAVQASSRVHSSNFHAFQSTTHGNWIILVQLCGQMNIS